LRGCQPFQEERLAHAGVLGSSHFPADVAGPHQLSRLPFVRQAIPAYPRCNGRRGANQNVNYADVAKAGTVNGRHMSQTLAIDGATLGTTTIKAGEVFTIAGVFAYDNRKQAAVTPARLQQFTVIEDATAVAGAIAALRIFPAIIVPGSGSGDNIAINTAHATVSAAPADGADLTFIGASGATLSPRVLIQKEAVVVNTVPLILPASDTSMRRRLSKIPLTVRMWQHSDFYTGEHGVRFDVALNTNIRERMRICRMNGS